MGGWIEIRNVWKYRDLDEQWRGRNSIRGNRMCKYMKIMKVLMKLENLETFIESVKCTIEVIKLILIGFI